jgi:hypothetical protein
MELENISLCGFQSRFSAKNILVKLILWLLVIINIYYVLPYLLFMFIVMPCVVRPCFISEVYIRFFCRAVVHGVLRYKIWESFIFLLLTALSVLLYLKPLELCNLMPTRLDLSVKTARFNSQLKYISEVEVKRQEACVCPSLHYLYCSAASRRCSMNWSLYCCGALEMNWAWTGSFVRALPCLSNISWRKNARGPQFLPGLDLVGFVRVLDCSRFFSNGSIKGSNAVFD